jgi:hypothetical protein
MDMDTPLYWYRMSTLIEKGNGERIWITLSRTMTAGTVKQAEKMFAARLAKDGERALTLDDFDLTGPALGLEESIDILWTGQVQAQRAI